MYVFAEEDLLKDDDVSPREEERCGRTSDAHTDVSGSHVSEFSRRSVSIP